MIWQDEGRDGQIVRTVAGLDAGAAEKVALRARAARELKDRLTCHAPWRGDEMEHEVDQVVFMDDHDSNILTGTALLHAREEERG